MPDRHEHDTEATVGDEDKASVGRTTGSDDEFAGETGAEARSEAASSKDREQ